MGHKQRQILSIKSKIEWQRMNEVERRLFVTKMKSQIAVMFVQATFLVQTKNLNKAKEMFMIIADSCMCIYQPDEQVKKWTDISCRYIGLLYLHQQKNEESNLTSEQKHQDQQAQLIKLRYNKILNQFQISPRKYENQYEAGTHINQNILQYISKINSILFANKNNGVSSPIIVMFTQYWIPFLLIFIILFIAFFLLARGDLFKVIIGESLEPFVPQGILFLLFIIPLALVCLKSPYQNSDVFFEKKLGKCINQINKDCKNRGLNYYFFRLLKGKTIYVKKIDTNVEDEVQQSLHLLLIKIRYKIINFLIKITQKVIKNLKCWHIQI